MEGLDRKHMKYYDCLVHNINNFDDSIFENLQLIIKLLAQTKKCKFRQVEYDEDRKLSHTFKWEDLENEIIVTYCKNLTIPAISIVIEAEDLDLFNFFRDFISEKLDIYSIDAIMSTTQDIIEKNPNLLKIASLGTYFLKPYPFEINFLISENLFSSNIELQKSAIIAAGIAGKETFRYDLLELEKDDLDPEIKKLIAKSLDVISYCEKNMPQFFTMD